MDVHENHVTAFIGPSGCGKSTFIRCFNRMNDLIESARVDGRSCTTARTSTAPSVDAVEVRKRIGMVFQKPNPFPKSIYDNIAFGPRVLGMKDDLDERVERALRQAALWDEVKDRLKDNAYGLSGGQQQRLCIARCIAIDPEVILMDEPCSALDPISTAAIEDLMVELKKEFTIVIVTHNMQQAARVADKTAFFSVELDRRAASSAPAYSSSTTRRRRSSPTPPTSGRRTTSQDGSGERGDVHAEVRRASADPPSTRSSTQLEATLQEQGSARPPLDPRRARTRSTRQDVELADEVIAFDDEIDAAVRSRSSRQVERILARTVAGRVASSGSCSRSST